MAVAFLIYVHTLFSPCISFRDLGLPSLPITLGPCLFCKWPSYPFFDLKNTSQCEHRNSDALWTFGMHQYGISMGAWGKKDVMERAKGIKERGMIDIPV